MAGYIGKQAVVLSTTAADVNGDADIDGKLDVSNANTLGSTFTGSTEGQGIRVSQDSYTSGDYVSLIDGTYVDSGTGADVRIGAMYDSGGSSLSFGVTQTYGQISREAMHIHSDGNVGIGTSSPNRELEVTGSGNVYVRVVAPTASDAAGLELVNTGATWLIQNDDGSDDSLTFDRAGSEKLRILSSGGITFNGDTAAANALDDYEEGSWTPAVVGSTTSGTTAYGSDGQRGHYVKIGNWVHAQGYLNVSSQTGTGSLVIEGLPFNTSAHASNRAQATGIIMTRNLDLPATSNMTLYADPGNDSLYIYLSRDNNSWVATSMTNELWSAHFSISYLTW